VSDRPSRLSHVPALRGGVGGPRAERYDVWNRAPPVLDGSSDDTSPKGVSPRKRIIPFLLLAFVAVACERDGPTVPVDGPQFAKGKPNCDIDPSHPSCKDDSGGEGTVVETASGDYWMTVYRLPDGPYQNRWAWFDAKKYEDGTVVGEWRVERYSISNGRRVSKSRGKISCFTIEGNQAWFGGTQKGVHGDVLWRVVDGVPDDASLACNRMPFPGGYYGCFELADYNSEMYCADTPPHPVLDPPIDSGTVVLEVTPPQ
jgi:hypothetical protein